MTLRGKDSRRRRKPAIGAFLLAIGLLATSACAREALEPPGEAVRSAPERRTIGFEPTTIVLSPDAELEQALQAIVRLQAAAPALRLTVEGVQTPGDARVGVRVFLNLPSATLATPLDDPHFVGSFTFFPAGDDQPLRDYALDAAPVVRKLDAAGEFSPGAPLKLTLIAAPLDPTESLGRVEIPYRSVTLSPPR